MTWWARGRCCERGKGRRASAAGSAAGPWSTSRCLQHLSNQIDQAKLCTAPLRFRSLNDLDLGAGRRGRARAQAWPPTGTLRMSGGRSATLRARRKWRRGGGNGGRAGVRLSPFLPHRPSVPLGFNTRAFITSAFTSETETPKSKRWDPSTRGPPVLGLPARGPRAF